jgi:hypothetical protein
MASACSKMTLLNGIRISVLRNAYKILVGKPGGKILLETLRCRWEDTIKIDLKGGVRFWNKFM